MMYAHETPSVELHSAAHYSIGTLALLLNHAYADYYFPIWLNEARFLQMCRELEIDLQHSVVASVGEPVGLALLSHRGTRGWISGVGVLPLYRRRGIGREMLLHLREKAQMLGVRTLQLEVLVQNEGGMAFYRRLGFRWQRDLLTLSLEARGLDAVAGSLPDSITPMPPRLLLKRYEAFHDVPQPWMREVRTLQRSDGLLGIAALEHGIVVGYLLYREQLHHQIVHDLAVQPHHPHRIHVAQQLLEAMHNRRPESSSYVAMWPTGDLLLTAFVRTGYRIWQRQSEMVWAIE